MKTLLIVLCCICLCTGIDSTWIQMTDFDDELIQIEIKGHVKNPGIVSVPYGSNLNDALKQIELFEDSDLSQLNLMMNVHDHDVITIQKMSIDLIYLNSASLEELCTLPGIGPSLAQRILDYRNEHLFQTIEELMNVKGIGEKKFESIREKIGL